MLKANKSSSWGTAKVPLPEDTVPNSQEELSSPEHEPDPEVSFHQFRPPQPVPSMLGLTLRTPKWNGQLKMGFTTDF